ncbi:MAG: pyridoxamine 5'-phosphate oxidase family protein [Dehalococcoidales bacterium]|nr:pyridoxamine 5'-phosphate oxidase family protein [Dehalococcoidales bacterium]
MQQVYEFLKNSGAYFLATIDGNQPRVRPFSTVNIFEDKLYILTGKKKNGSKQMMKNDQIEICAMGGDHEWIRVQAAAVNDDRVEAKESMLEAYPHLKTKYSAADDNTQVLYLKDAVATISSFSHEDIVIKF